jgi:predicted GH43/DUF377 family glycosyl hydrolase
MTRLRNLLVSSIVFLASLAPGATAHASAGSLPDWAIGPFARYAGNPILKPQGTGWESLEVFNPGVVRVNGVYHMLYRGTRPVNISAIGAATSTDGVHFTRYAGNPVIGHQFADESIGSEDPRLFYLDGTYYTFYTGFSTSGTELNEATSSDALHWHQLGAVISGTKNGALVANPQGRPVRIDGQYLMYYGSGFGNTGGIGYATSPDMVHWTPRGTVNLNYPQAAVVEVCVAVTGYRAVTGAPLNHNIVLFTAGHLNAQQPSYYEISEEEFSSRSPATMLGQLSGPVLAPATRYEEAGVTPEAVFMNTIIWAGGEWRMYYGAADTVTGLASAPLRPGG